MRCVNIIDNISFRAGKVQVYSDFDGTYCPAKHSSLHNPDENAFMKEYCAKMDTFFKSTEGDLHFHVTTGRTFGEYEAISHLLKRRGFHLTLPESFISKNGSDEYIKAGSDSNFYEKGIFPYSYSKPDKIKEDNIRKITGWNGEELKNYIRELARKYNIRFIEADSENSVKDYGSNSLFSEGKLNADEWKKLPAKTEYALGSRNDGNLKVNLIFSPDYGHCPERNKIYDNFMNEIKNFLNSKKVYYNMQWENPNRHNHYRIHCNITPQISNSPLTKLYDTREALKNAIKNNDIVITAGDGSNDFEMLNPLEYITEEEWNEFKKNSQNKDFFNGDMSKKLSDLKDVYSGNNNSLKAELETNGFLKKVEEMPVYSIIIKKENLKLGILRDVFAKTGKVIEVEKGGLDSGIRELVKLHSKNNDSFKNAMSDRFKEFIFGKTIKKKSYKTAVIAAIVAFIGVALLVIKSQKGHKNENSYRRF